LDRVVNRLEYIEKEIIGQEFECEFVGRIDPNDNNECPVAGWNLSTYESLYVVMADNTMNLTVPKFKFY
jgi:hypothetical protein